MQQYKKIETLLKRANTKTNLQKQTNKYSKVSISPKCLPGRYMFTLHAMARWHGGGGRNRVRPFPPCSIGLRGSLWPREAM